MIRRLVESDRSALSRLLSEAPEFNLYLLGNLDALGFDGEISHFWGDFDGDSLRGAANLYMTGWSVYGHTDADWAGIAVHVDEHPIQAERLQDNPGGIQSLLPYLRRYTATWLGEEELMTLEAQDLHAQPAPPNVQVRRAGWGDLDELVALYADAGDMRRSRTGVELPLRDRRIWVAVVGAQIAAVALTNAETATMAMVGGVYTPPRRRGLGLSQAVCSALCAELIAEKKRPVLYWKNQAAGAIYRKLGFRAIGMWRSVRLARIPTD